MTKQHEFRAFDLLDVPEVGGRMGYADDEYELEPDDAAARLTIIKRKVALLMVRSGLGDAFPGQQQQLLPSVRVLTRWPMLYVFF